MRKTMQIAAGVFFCFLLHYEAAAEDEPKKFTAEVTTGTSSRDAFGEWFGRAQSGGFFQTVGAKVTYGSDLIFAGDLFYQHALGSRLGFENQKARLEAISPHFLGSEKLFVVGGLTYDHSYWELKFNNQPEDPVTFVPTAVSLSAHAIVGTRIAEHSYVSFGSDYAFWKKGKCAIVAPGDSGEDASCNASLPDTLRYTAQYGWNSTDSPYFPTDGSVLLANWNFPNLSLFDNVHPQFFFRKYLSFFERSLALLNVWWSNKQPQVHSVARIFFPADYQADQLGLSVGYGYDFARGAQSATIPNARWTIEGGLMQRAYGARTGLTMEVASFGVVNLFFLVEFYRQYLFSFDLD